MTDARWRLSGVRINTIAALASLATVAALVLLPPPPAHALATPGSTLTGAPAKGDPLPNTEALRSYGLWGEDLVATRVAPVHAAGKVPVLSIKNAIRGGTWRGPTWAQMCTGSGADYLRPQLAALGGLGYPVWLTLDHEPDVIVKNDPTGVATSADYACAFRALQTIAAEEGASNIRWYSALLVPSYKDGTAASYVDGVELDAAGVDLYMYGPLDSGEALCQPSRIAEAEQFARARGVPLVLPEWGVSANVMTDSQRATCIERWATWHDGWAGSPFLLYFSTPTSAGTLNTRILTSTPAAYAAYSRATADTTPPADNTAPQVSVRTPTGGAAVSGTVSVTADVSDDTGVTAVELQVDGVGAGTASAPYAPATMPWDSAGVPDGQHVLRVVARDAAGNTSIGASVTVEVNNQGDTEPPSAPSALTATATGQTATRLEWQPATDDVGVTAYRISRDGTALATVSAAGYHDNGLSPATSYAYSVVAIDAAGNGSAPATTTVTTDAAPAPVPVPSGLSASAPNSTTVNLSWDDAGPGVTGYRLYRDGAEVASPTGASYADTGLTAERAYDYALAAVDGAGRISARSAEVSVTTPQPAPPTTPTGVSAISTTPSTVSLAWTASTAERGVAGYSVFRNGSRIADVRSGIGYSDAGLAAGTTYSYAVEAYDTGGAVSGRSAAVSATTARPPLTAPAGLTVSAVSYTSATLRWSANSADQGVTGYRLYRDGTLVASGSATSYTDSPLRPATSYSYTVTAYTATATSPASAAVAARTSTDNLAPSVPGSPRASTSMSYKVTVSWSPSQDTGGSTVAGYRVYRSDRGTSPIATVAAGTTGYADTLVSAGTRYTYRVAAVDSVGNASAQSAAASATTATARERTTPTAATALRVTATTSSTIMFAWTAARDNVALAGYHVYRNGIYVGDSTTTSFRDAGLAPLTAYSYYLVAFDTSANRSANSATLRATSGG